MSHHSFSVLKDRSELDSEVGAVACIARITHEACRAHTIATSGDPAPPWEEADPELQESTKEAVRDRLLCTLGELSRGEYVGVAGEDAERSHDAWVFARLQQGWTYGAELDRGLKRHPNLVPFSKLPEHEKLKDYLFLSICDAFAVMRMDGRDD